MTLTALSQLVLLALKHIRDGDIARRLPQWGGIFRAAVEGSGFDALIRILMYISESVEQVSLDDLQWTGDSVGVSAEEVAMTLAEKLRQEGREQGREQGRKEGRKEGRVQTLLRLLALRFGNVPAQVAARLKEAKLADLELMTERVLTAATLDEVLNSPS